MNEYNVPRESITYFTLGLWERVIGEQLWSGSTCLCLVVNIGLREMRMRQRPLAPMAGGAFPLG
jgi:hypothetical protein